MNQKPAAQNKRIEVLFQPQAEGEDGEAVDIDCGITVDVTSRVLALSLEKIRRLDDVDFVTDTILHAHALEHDGPCRVEVVDAVCAFFGVAALADITEDILAAHRLGATAAPTATLVSSEHGFDDYDVEGIPTVHRVTVGHGIRKGDVFNVYCEESRKIGCVWQGTLEKSLAHVAARIAADAAAEAATQAPEPALDAGSDGARPQAEQRVIKHGSTSSGPDRTFFVSYVCGDRVGAGMSGIQTPERCQSVAEEYSRMYGAPIVTPTLTSEPR